MADSKNNDSPIKDIVNRVITDLSTGTAAHRRINAEEINILWKKAAGEFARRRSGPTSLRKGRLVVAVGDSSLLYNLTLRKKEILASLAKESDGRIKEIQFRIGDTSGKTEGKRTETKSKRRR